MITLPLVSPIAIAQLSPSASDSHVYRYHQPDILGTTLDLKLIAASQSDADACAQTVLKEVERLRRILSTYDSLSEIRRFEADPSTLPITVSTELREVLADYIHWHYITGGAYSLQLGDLLALWDSAEKKGIPPTDAEIAPLLTKAHQNALTLVSNTTIRKLVPQKLNIDSLGKGFIVQKAAAAAKAAHPLVTGILLNIGGDITAIGFATPPATTPALPWTIDIADPQQLSDNAPPIARIAIKDKAVATSGAYERFYTFGTTKLSHILNPLTGKPSTNGVLSATVVAADNATANALATTLCVLPPTDGIKLIEKTPDAAAILLMTGGNQLESKGFAAYKLPPENVASSATASPTVAATPKPTPTPTPMPTPTPADDNSRSKPGDAWPKDFALSIDLNELPFAPNPDYIPYTSIWIEDANDKCVKILAAWIGDKKYLRVMRRYPKECRSSPDYASITRATRRVGRYTIAWDGLDSTQTAVPTGEYSVCVEVCCEHGGHSIAKQKITCGTAPASITVPAAQMWSPILVNYGPAKTKTSTD